MNAKEFIRANEKDKRGPSFNCCISEEWCARCQHQTEHLNGVCRACGNNKYADSSIDYHVDYISRSGIEKKELYYFDFSGVFEYMKQKESYWKGELKRKMHESGCLLNEYTHRLAHTKGEIATRLLLVEFVKRLAEIRKS